MYRYTQKRGRETRQCIHIAACLLPMTTHTSSGLCSQSHHLLSTLDPLHLDPRVKQTSFLYKAIWLCCFIIAMKRDYHWSQNLLKMWRLVPWQIEPLTLWECSVGVWQWPKLSRGTRLVKTHLSIFYES